MIDLKGKSPKILVIGDLMIDHYLWGSCERISPEAPVQVINVDNESMLLGGAGNVINTAFYSQIEQEICFTPHALNMIPTGPKLARSLRVGDKVVTRNNGAKKLA